jgi:hypothetical protein
VGQAAAITAASSFVAAKSMRWGLIASIRNGVLAGAIATAMVFPDELRQASRRAFASVQGSDDSS